MAAGVGSMAMGDARITIVFDNDAAGPGLKYGWGFAAVVERGGARQLFDTGPDPKALTHNLGRLGFDPATFDSVVISHDHWDHTGGLAGILRARPGIEVHIPASGLADLGRRIERLGGRPIGHGPALEADPETPLAEIAPGVLTTGEMAASPLEHSLVLPGPDGPAVLTGCCHQGIVRRLRELGVVRVVPTHCTGRAGIAALAREFGPDCLRGGAGRVIELAG